MYDENCRIEEKSYAKYESDKGSYATAGAGYKK